MGDGTHCVGFRKELRAQAGGVQDGDAVTIEIARDDAPRTVAIPADLAAALDADPAVRAAFDAMSYTHRKEWGAAVVDTKRPQRAQSGWGADRVEIGAGVARACPPTYRKVCFETCLSIRAG